MKYLVIIPLTVSLLIGCVAQKSEIRTVRVMNTGIEARCGYHEACVVISGNSCEIIAPKPKDHLDHKGMERLGHELWHCFYSKEHV